MQYHTVSLSEIGSNSDEDVESIVTLIGYSGEECIESLRMKNNIQVQRLKPFKNHFPGIPFIFFIPPKATEPQEVHDEYLEYLNGVEWKGIKNLKSLYYLRSNASRNAENVNIKIPKINLEEEECISCEG